ncbi:MAG TPA: uL15 family ribosomal protein [Candidatus Bathyarchaeia archaeon]
MATRHRKTRRLRGSRTHGWGRSGQHRGSGNQGGHGNAGWKRHKWSAVIRYGIEIGERGFHPVRPRIDHTINVGDLDQQLERFLQDGTAKQDNGKIRLDLTKAGYQKLLGQGTIKRPVRVIVLRASEHAVEKVREAGGEIVLPSQPKKE